MGFCHILYLNIKMHMCIECTRIFAIFNTHAFIYLYTHKYTLRIKIEKKKN